ncbi:Uncharacterised protein [uncultured archaeon]|nr:Uncharacterised protein [uncultured archaeon]
MTVPWKSKTFWTNIVLALALFVSTQFGYQITPQETVLILAGINLILRAITKEPIDWGGSPPAT